MVMELSFLALMLFKHAIADLWLQSIRTPNLKSNYFGGHWHYFDLGVLTLFVAIFLAPWQFAILVGCIDYFFHWHVDFLKHRLLKHYEVRSEDSPSLYWGVQAWDQILHYLTYVLIAFSYQLYLSLIHI